MSPSGETDLAVVSLVIEIAGDGVSGILLPAKATSVFVFMVTVVVCLSPAFGWRRRGAFGSSPGEISLTETAEEVLDEDWPAVWGWPEAPGCVGGAGTAVDSCWIFWVR